MRKSKTLAWCWIIIALLFIAGGLRDIFAPGFLSVSARPQPKGTLDIAFTLTAGVIFLAIAVYQVVKARGEKGKLGP
jgi:hypothetical protein